MAAVNANSQSEAWTVIESSGENDQVENFEIIHPNGELQASEINPYATSEQIFKNLKKIVLKSKKRVTASRRPDYELLSNLLFCWFIVVNLVLTTVFSQLMRQDLKIQHYLNSTKEVYKQLLVDKDIHQVPPINSNIIPRLLAKYLDLDHNNLNFEYNNVHTEYENILKKIEEQSQEMKQIKSSVQELKLYFDQMQYDIVKQIVDFRNELTSTDNSLRQHSNAWTDFVNMVNMMVAEMQKRNLYSSWMDSREQRSL